MIKRLGTQRPLVRGDRRQQKEPRSFDVSLNNQGTAPAKKSYANCYCYGPAYPPCPG